MAEARVNGVTLNYRQSGAGPDVVLIHGLGANQAFWNLSIVSALSRHFRVTLYDLRGHGYSAMPPDGYRSADMAADLRGLLDHLNIRAAHLVGHSFGGRVALAFALAEPRRTLSLTIADTRLRSLQPEQAVTQSPDWPAFRALLAENGICIDEGEPEIGFCLFEAFARLPADQIGPRTDGSPVYTPFGGNGSRSARRWLQLLESTTIKADYRAGADIAPEELTRLRLPVLALYGACSPTRQTGEQLGQWLPDCRAVFVPEGRHFHPATHPQVFRDALLAFLEAVSAVQEDRPQSLLTGGNP